MIRAFFDESADDPREKAFVLAGWVSDVEEWQRLAKCFREN